MRTRLNWPVIITVGALLMGACAGPEPTPTPTLDTEAAYLAQVEEVQGVLDASFSKIATTLGPLFPRTAPQKIQARVMSNELAQLEMSETTVEMLAMAEALEPPEGRRADHQVFLSSLRDRVALAAQFDEAIAREDFPGLHLAAAEMFASANVTLASVSPDFCRRLVMAENVATPADAEEVFCGDPASIPGGDYGAQVWSITKGFVAQFRPRADFLPGMSEADLMAGLEYVQPAIEQVFRETLDKLGILEPPAEYTEGHDVLVAYFQGRLDTAFAIDRAVAARNHDEVQRLFARSGEIAQVAEESLPAAYRPMVRPIFGAEDTGG